MSENSTKDNEAKTPEKEWHLDVSEEQYAEMKAKGVDEESLFKPGRHTFRRRDPNAARAPPGTTGSKGRHRGLAALAELSWR